MEEQERLKEVSNRKEREKQLENQTLYIFDAEKAELSGMDILKVKTRKFTECDIDLKDFLLSEKDNLKKKMLAKSQSSDSKERFENKF